MRLGDTWYKLRSYGGEYVQTKLHIVPSEVVAEDLNAVCDGDFDTGNQAVADFESFSLTTIRPRVGVSQYAWKKDNWNKRNVVMKTLAGAIWEL